MEQIVDDFLASTGTPGALAGVWIPGHGAWTYAAGVGNLEATTPIALDDAVRIASITKTFTATVVLQLVDEGMLGLDDVLETYYPGMPNGDRITIRHLLGMRAGLFNWVEDPGFEEAFDADPLMEWSPEQGIDLARTNPVYFEPGEGFHYAETNYFLLGVIAENLTGKPIHDLITERILTPLGLQRTSFATTPEMPEPYVRGYLADPAGGAARDVTAVNPDVPWTAGAMISTIDDLRVWSEALVGGTLLSPGTQAERLKTLPISADAPFRYGLGIFEVLGFFGHNGGIYGYSTFIGHRPDDGATIVTATNLADNDGGGADQIFASLAQLLYPSLFGA